MKRLAILAIIVCAWFHIAPAHAQFNGCSSFCGTSSSAIADAPGFNNIQASGAAGLPLDGITTGIKAAYSTRKLLTAYAGNAIQVQETTGNTTSNIGFVANVLDTATLSTFCSGKTCKVITWYDQSGGGFNQTQGTIANAPIIFQSGAVNAINTKPAILFVAATPTSLGNASLSANPVNTLYENAVINWTSGTGGIVGCLAGAALEWRVDGPTISLLKTSSANIGTSSLSLTASTGAIAETQYNSTTGAFSFWVNRSAAGTGTSAQTLVATSIVVGSNTSNSESFNGSIGEVILYDLVGGIPGASQTAIENNQHTFWGTP